MKAFYDSRCFNSYKINADLYKNITDFTKTIAIVPCSARTGEGISEILAMLAALSQKFLQEKISIKEETKGSNPWSKKRQRSKLSRINFIRWRIVKHRRISNSDIWRVVTTKIRNIQEALPLNKGLKSLKKLQQLQG